jgi:site-specific DNA recombinase
MNVVAYCRCSSDRQEDSPHVQLAAIRDHCTRQSWNIIGEYSDEDISGGIRLESRPGFSRLLREYTLLGAEAIICLRLDRLTRDLADQIAFFASIEKRHLKVFFVSEHFGQDAQGQLMQQIVGAFNQYYRADIGQKIKEHNLWLVRQGKWPGGRVPFGYYYDLAAKRILPHPIHQHEARVVFDTFIATGGSRNGTAVRLNGMGMRTSLGKRWTNQIVLNTIGASLYVGEIDYADQLFPIDLPAIVPPATVNKARELLARTRGCPQRAIEDSPYIYTQLLYCLRCGGKVSGFKIAGSKPRTHSNTYKCNGKRYGRCDAPIIMEKSIDAVVVPQLVKIVRGSVRPAKHRPERPYRVPQIDLEALEQKRVRFVEAWSDGLIDKAMMQKRISDLDQQLLQVRRAQPQEVFKPDPELATFVLENLERLWGSMMPLEKRPILEELITSVSVDNLRPGTRARIVSRLDGAVLNVKT